MVGVNGIVAVLPPYTAENYPILVRGRATGMVAGCSKFGGLAANALTMASLVPRPRVRGHSSGRSHRGFTGGDLRTFPTTLGSIGKQT